MIQPPHGMHHVSSLSGDIVRNHAFYTGVLGLRLVKRSVNQDDPTMYHLFYADAIGSPGSDVTFFDVPGAARGLRGNRSIARLSLRASGDAVGYWAARLAKHGVAVGAAREVDGAVALDFDDVDGTPLRLVADGDRGPDHPWERGPVPADAQLRGLGYATLAVPELSPTDRFLVDGLRLERARDYEAPDGGAVHVYAMHGSGPASEVHVAVRPDLAPARYGAGSVHHLALRVPDRAALEAWRDHLNALGYPNSGLVDRHWFESVYVREPGGVLFELATDGPGFAVDEDAAALGERLALPPRLEPRRAEIEAGLRPLSTV